MFGNLFFGLFFLLFFVCLHPDWKILKGDPGSLFRNNTKVSYYRNAKIHLVNTQKSPYFKAYYGHVESLYH